MQSVRSEIRIVMPAQGYWLGDVNAYRRQRADGRTAGGAFFGGVGNVVMKARRSEAARGEGWADESNLPHA